MNAQILRRKIVLGTVQLGLPYGINNSRGKPDSAEAFAILRKAESEGIHLLDSAEAYGEALDIIGQYLKVNNASFDVISKFHGGVASIETQVSKTLETLGIDSLYGYMYHRFSDYVSGTYREKLAELQKDGKIRRIGVSLYNTEELEACVRDEMISFIQIPYNPFDSSTKKIDLLNSARRFGKEIHVRSVFLQGLFFKEPATLTGNLKQFFPALTEFHRRINEMEIDVRRACLHYALAPSYVDRVVIGVETAAQLNENLIALDNPVPDALYSLLRTIEVSDTTLLNPSNWRP